MMLFLLLVFMYLLGAGFIHSFCKDLSKVPLIDHNAWGIRNFLCVIWLIICILFVVAFAIFGPVDNPNPSTKSKIQKVKPSIKVETNDNIQNTEPLEDVSNSTTSESQNISETNSVKETKSLVTPQKPVPQRPIPKPNMDIDDAMDAFNN